MLLPIELHQRSRRPNMDCRKCRAHLASEKELFFFVRSEKEISLVLKPEYRASLFDKTFVRAEESKKTVRIKCKKCQDNLGRDLPFGPSGSDYAAFGTDKIVLRGYTFTAKQKWSELQKRFKEIDERNLESFYGETIVDDNMDTEECVDEHHDIKESIRFASVTNDFEWFSLTPRIRPRDYQIDAYLEALQQNLVVVIDTGLGKTLIATMVIARMKLLNPYRMAVMLVDRIPLVFQQGQAIMKETDLRVCCLCSQNRTKRRVKQLKDGTYDVLVITAGSFLEMLNRKQIKVFHFCVIVFDECHHASGNHVYTKVLQEIQACPPCDSPRVLGLTASPFKVENVVKGRNQLEKFRSTFLNASFFYPNIENSKNEGLQVTVCRSEEQNQFIEDVIGVIKTSVNGVNKFFKGYCNSNDIKHSSLIHLKGDIRALLGEYPDTKKAQTLAKEILFLIDVVEVCELLGLSHALAIIEDSKDLSFMLKNLQNKYMHVETEAAPRLIELEKLLDSCSSETRAIVFVRTQLTARRICEHLETKFPELKPRMVLGHGGHYGMRWEEDQKPTLSDFRDGETNLIVATSVLEEGLDVSKCDLVIRYSGPTTLINFIQSRGRARKEGSKFYVFIDSESMKSTQRLEDQERILRHLINVEGTRDRLPSDQSKKFKELVKREFPIQATEQHQTKATEEVDRRRVIVVEFYVRIQDDQLSLRDALVSEIEELDIFSVNRLYQIEKEAEVASGVATVFNNSDKAFIVSLKSDFDDVIRAFECFCNQWDFELTSLYQNNNVSHVWCRHDLDKAGVGAADTIWEPDIVEFGKFTSNQTFESSASFCRRMDNMLDIAVDNPYEVNALEFRQKIELRVDNSCTIAFSQTDLNNFALISTVNGKVWLYLPYKFVPSVHCYQKMLLGDNFLAKTVADNSVMAVAFEKSFFYKLFVTLSSPSVLSVPLFITQMKHEDSCKLKHTLRKTISKVEADPRAEDCIWLLRALSSRKDICVPNRCLLYFYQQVENDLEEGATKLTEIEIALRRLLSSNDSYWTDLKEVFDRNIEFLCQLTPSAIKLVKTAIPANHVLVKRIVITPKQIICLPATPVASSRLLRNYGGTHDFIIVSFRGEHFQKLEVEETFRRVQGFIIYGIHHFKQYWFFCASASQLRDHKAYFIAANSNFEAQELRSRIVTNKHVFKSTARFLSRVGLFGTADKPTIPLAEERIRKIPDIRAANGDMVTDGCGKISRSLAQKIHEVLEPEELMPSAFQIRFKGIKGVVLVADENDADMKGADVVYRDSMHKFENDDDNFCVVGKAKFIKLYLNREVITLLTSIHRSLIKDTEEHWPIENAIIDLHEKAICDAAKIFEDSRTARIALMEYLPKPLLKQIVDAGFDLLTEKFWFSLLRHVYRLSVISLRNKSRIPVDDGCLIMGAADPTGLLQDEEIFLQIKEDDEKLPRVIEGKVLIYRNPCLHPGDLRWVTAVNHSLLHQWVNVVLLPTCGARTSLASACSGGDLDGDQFAIIWDPRFIVPGGYQYKPLNYSELAKNAPEDYSPEMEAALFASLYVKIMRNDTLGRVAHTHLALCDIQPDGACDPCAMELAKSQSQAVDFPKTGIIPLVPEKALDIVKENGYPDFMEKSNPYVSNRILGILYRRCRSVMFDFEILTEKRLGYQSIFDFELNVKGNDAYIADAKEKYKMYKKSLRAIMGHYSLKREADVVLGRPLHWDPLLKADKGSASAAITKSYEALVKKYREEFFRDVNNQDQIRKKASAWYRVSYENRFSQTGSSSVYSFAWVVYDILCGIKRERQEAQVCRPNFVYDQIGASIYEELCDSKLHVKSIISSKENVLRCVRAEIERFAGPKSFDVTSYGSVSMYLCDEESDLDVCLSTLEKAWLRFPSDAAGDIRLADETTQAKHFLEMMITHAVDEIASEKVHKLYAKVPLISIKVGDTDNETKVDISFNKIGLLKTQFMHELYNSNHLIFPILWILVRWARSVGVIKSGTEAKLDAEENEENTPEKKRDGNETEGLIASAEFYALVINLLDLSAKKDEKEKKGKRTVKKRKGKQICSLSKIFDDAERAAKERENKIKVADMLITFFRRGSVLDSDIELVWSHDQIPNVPLTGEVIKLIATHCMNALHCILATRSIKTMLSSIRDTNQQSISYSRKLPSTLVSAFGKAQSFHAARLSNLTGADVQIKDDRVVIATGTRSAIMKLKEELHNLSVTNRALMLGRLPRQSSRYFMEGSMIILMKKNTSSDAMVVLEESKGPWNMLHNSAERHHPKLKSEPLHDWYEKALDRINDKLFQQMHKLKVPLKNNAAVAESLHLSMLFGCFYTIEKSRSIPVSQHTISVSELEQKIEKGGRSRKQWERGEFVGSSPEKNTGFAGVKIQLKPGEKSSSKDKLKKEKKVQKSSISSSFCEGIFAKNSPDKITIESCISFYKCALDKCGFREGSNGYIRDKEGWKVHCWPSTSYEACLRLNKEKRVDCVEEHALKWLCVNILEGEKQENVKNLLVNSDIRVNIVTKDPVKEDSVLYKKLVPDAECPVLEEKEGGKPVISDKYPDESKKCISNLQHIHTCLEFCKEDFDAVIVQGTTFRGKDFKVSRQFCNLTLRYNPALLREFVTSDIDVAGCRKFADHLCRTGLELSNALKESIQQSEVLA